MVNYKTILDVYKNLNLLVKSDNVITDEDNIIIDVYNRFASENLCQLIDEESYTTFINKRKIPKFREDLLGGLKYSPHCKPTSPRMDISKYGFNVKFIENENLKQLVLYDIWKQLFSALPDRFRIFSKEDMSNIEKYGFIPEIKLNNKKMIEAEGIKIENTPFEVITDKICNLLDFMIKYPRFSPFQK